MQKVKSCSFSKSGLREFGSLVALCLLIVGSASMLASAISLVEQADSVGRQSGPTLALVESPELTVRVLESLLRSIVYSASAADFQSTGR